MMNSNASVGSGASESTGWATMGGGPNDGIPTPSNVYSTPQFGTPSPLQAPSGTTTNRSNFAGSGSITRFATPDMQPPQPQQQLGYAARSQQQQQGGGGGGGGGYAARSLAYGAAAPPQQQQYHGGSSGSPGYNNNKASSGPTMQHQQSAPQPYASPQQLQQQQQHGYSGGGGGGTNNSIASGSSYAARSQQYGAAAAQHGSVPQQQQQPNYGGAQQQPHANQTNVYGGQLQQQQRNIYGGQQPLVQQQQQPSLSGGSYAGRSAASVPPQQQGSNRFAARSEAALYGQQQQQQQQQMGAYSHQQPQGYPPTGGMPQQQQVAPKGAPPVLGLESTAQQQRLLTEATRKVQEHSYYMKQAMEQQSLPVVLDRAAHMVGELGGPPHGQQQSGAPVNTGGSAKLNPKNYYELYMRALEDMPALEEYLLALAVKQDEAEPAAAAPASVPAFPDNSMIRIVEHASQLNQPNHQPFSAPSYTMRQLYDCVQYCPRVVSRLYLQICAGAALIRSGEAGCKWVMQDLQDAVKCEQNPVRGLFLRYFLVTSFRDKLTDTPAPLPNAPKVATTIESSEDEDNGDALEEKDDDSAADYDDQILSRKAVDELDKGTVQDSYEFVLANFMEMNKLWVRIQHLPGEGKNKDVRKRRERERNDLRILVGTNLVRLSQLECVTSKIYGEFILPKILEHVVTTGDPLSQAYLMDCLVQVFPDEYHIETLPILLNVCPRLRDKVNIRTILQGLMDRLANYLAEEELLDESDTNQVKKALARDSFGLFEDCVQKVYNSRGPKLTSKEVIRLQTALLQFSIKCYPGNMEQVSSCINSCVSALRQANASYDMPPEGHVATNVSPPSIKALDDASVVELEKLLSIPLDSLALRVLELDQYSVLIGFLPWANRREVAMTLLKAVENAGTTPTNCKEIEQLFNVIEPLVSNDGNGEYNMMQQGGLVDPMQLKKLQEENLYVAKLIHLLDHEDTDVVYEMLQVARNHIARATSGSKAGSTLVAVVFAALRLARRVFDAEQGLPAEAALTSDVVEEVKVAVEPENGGAKSDPVNDDDKKETPENEDKSEPAKVTVDEAEEQEPADETEPTADEVATAPVKEADEKEATSAIAEGTRDVAGVTRQKTISSRKIFAFVQASVATLASHNPERAVKLYLDVALSADTFTTLAKEGIGEVDYAPIAYELLTQAFSLYEEHITDGKAQYRCINAMSGTLLALRSLGKGDYESLITKTAQFSAKVLKKPDQCQLVALCAHLFYPVGGDGNVDYSNPQRALECLQRSLKLADACTSMNQAHVHLFVDLLEQYLFFFEKGNPLITHEYISGLAALIKEHLSNAHSSSVETRGQFLEVVRYVKARKADAESSELFTPVLVE